MLGVKDDHVAACSHPGLKRHPAQQIQLKAGKGAKKKDPLDAIYTGAWRSLIKLNIKFFLFKNDFRRAYNAVFIT